MKRLCFTIICIVSVLMGVTAGNNNSLQVDSMLTKGVLENGFTYYVKENGVASGYCSMFLAVRIGSIPQSPDDVGLAHFVEHMAFEGIRNFPGETAKWYLASKGVEYGSCFNANTSIMGTEYIIDMLPIMDEATLDSALMICRGIADGILFDSLYVEKEKNVIIEEGNMYKNVSARKSDNFTLSLCGSSYLSVDAIVGGKEQIEKITPSLLKRFYNRWYSPENMALVVVGDVDADALVPKIAEHFYTMKNSGEECGYTFSIPVKEGHRVNLFTDPEVTEHEITITLTSNPAKDTDKAELLSYLPYDSAYCKMLEYRFADISYREGSPVRNVEMVYSLLPGANHIHIDIIPEEQRVKEAIEMCLLELKRIELFGFKYFEFMRSASKLLQNSLSECYNSSVCPNKELATPLIDNFLSGRAMILPEEWFECLQFSLPNLDFAACGIDDKVTVPDYRNIHLNLIAPVDDPHGPDEEELQSIMDMVDSMPVATLGYAEPDSLFSFGLDCYPDTSSLDYGEVVGGDEYYWEMEYANGIRVVYLPEATTNTEMWFFVPGGFAKLEMDDWYLLDKDVDPLMMYARGVSGYPYAILNRAIYDKVTLRRELFENGMCLKICSEIGNGEEGFKLLNLYMTDRSYTQEGLEKAKELVRRRNESKHRTMDYNFSSGILKYYTVDGNKYDDIMHGNVDAATLDDIIRVDNLLTENVSDAVLYIRGYYELEELLRYLALYVGSIPAGSKPFVQDRYEYRFSNKECVEWEMPIVTPNAFVVQYIEWDEQYSAERNAKIGIVAEALGMLLNEELREKLGAIYGVNCEGCIDPTNNKSVAIFVNYTTSPERAKEVAKVSEKCLEMLADGDWDNETIERIIQNLAYMNIYNKVSDFSVNEYYMGLQNGINAREEYFKVLETLTPDDIYRYCKQILKDCRFNQFIFTGNNEE